MIRHSDLCWGRNYICSKIEKNTKKGLIELFLTAKPS